MHPRYCGGYFHLEEWKNLCFAQRDDDETRQLSYALALFVLICYISEHQTFTVCSVNDYHLFHIDYFIYFLYKPLMIHSDRNS